MRGSKIIKGGAAVGGMMAILIGFVADWEGLRLNAYYDAVGVPTICYGHTQGVHINDTANKAECDALLQSELGEYLAYVDRHVTVPMPDTRRAALASFTYNVGMGAFRRSTLLKKMNAGDTVGACDELLRWVYAKGKRLRGLERRRASERDLCLMGEHYVVADI